MPGAPDVIWLNGPFGAGKTTVAELPVERIDGATLVDPELVGEMLRALVADPRFAGHVDAEAREPAEIVADIVERLAA